MEHIKWIFSGIGVLIITLIIGYVNYRRNKKINTHKASGKKHLSRTVNQYGEKSIYIEKNDGNIKID